MVTIRAIVAGLVAAAATLLPGIHAQCPQLNPIAQPQMASGYQSRLFLNGIQRPRHIIFDSAGNLLVAAMGIHRISIQQDFGGVNICAGSRQTLIQDQRFDHGIALSGDGRTLYVSSSTQVLAYQYDPNSGSIGSPRTLINIPTQGGYHQTRTLLVPRNNPDTLLVSVGSQDNLDMATQNPSSGRSMIRAFNLNQLGSNPVAYNSGALWGWGLRNSVGLGENPVTGELWSVENGLDDMRRNGQDIHNDNPGEELNFHGRVNETNNGRYGQNFGYPYCHAIWQSVQGFSVGQQIIQGNPSGQFTDSYCQSQTLPPRLTFPAHMAPLDVKFHPNGRSAYISFHGSWNRSPPDGYRLSRIDFGADGQPIQPPTSTSAEIRVMQNPNTQSCSFNCFRPTGLAWDPRAQNRLFMSSDQSNEIYVVTVPQ